MLGLSLCYLLFVDPVFTYCLATKEEAQSLAVERFKRVQPYMCKRCNLEEFNSPVLIGSEHRSGNFLDKKKSYAFCFEYIGKLKPKPRLIGVSVIYQPLDLEIMEYLELIEVSSCVEASKRRKIDGTLG